MGLTSATVYEISQVTTFCTSWLTISIQKNPVVFETHTTGIGVGWKTDK